MKKLLALIVGLLCIPTLYGIGNFITRISNPSPYDAYLTGAPAGHRNYIAGNANGGGQYRVVAGSRQLIAEDYIIPWEYFKHSLEVNINGILYYIFEHNGPEGRIIYVKKDAASSGGKVLAAIPVGDSGVWDLTMEEDGVPVLTKL